MSISPTSPVSTIGQSNSDLEKPNPTVKEPKISFLRLGLGIYEQQHNSVCNLSAAKAGTTCYVFRGTGNIISTVDRKVYILTVAHLFNKDITEYILSDGGKLIFPFKYSPSDDERKTDGVCIPIGEMDPLNQGYILKSNSSFNGNLHLHS
jgi:hypothetical protein